MKRTDDDNEANEVGADNWMDLAGMIVPEKEIERLVHDVKKGNVVSSTELQLILSQINDDYLDNEASYARSIMQTAADSIFINTDEWLAKAEKARSLWIRLIKDDAEKEFQMGDVDEDFFRDFIAGVK